MTTAAPPVDAARILVVDDELGPRESLRMLLKPSYQIQTADSGRAALDQIPAYRPDIVILDIKMPELDGLEVLRRIKSDGRTRTLPIVVLTSSRERRDIQSCYMSGANSYIVKPVEYAELIAKLGDLVRYWLQLNEAANG